MQASAEIAALATAVFVGPGRAVIARVTRESHPLNVLRCRD